MDKFLPKTRLTDMAKNILRKRYFLPNEIKWQQITKRMVDFIITNNDDYNDTFDMIHHRYFIPNSPTIVNAGKVGGGLSACFVVDMTDSIQGIYETKLDFALIAKKGGGCGTTLSKLRPENSRVAGSTHGYAGGPVKFFDTICYDMKAMTQSGFREMAMMGTMSVYHPDIIKFITAKTEEGIMHTTNISVVVDNIFMQKVINNEKYWTNFNGNKYEEINARDIFDLIVDGAWKNGEPGLLFYDRINNSPYKYTHQEITATNPCVTGDTLVNTPFGYVQAQDLTEGDYVSTVNGKEKISKIEKTENQRVFSIDFSDGGNQLVTPNHIYYGLHKGTQSKKLEEIRAKDLQPGDYIRVFPSRLDFIGNEQDYEYYLKIGILLGDGCYTQHCYDSNFIKIASSQDDIEYNENIKTLFGKENFRKDDLDPNSKSMNMILSNGKSVVDGLGLTTNIAINKNYDVRNIKTVNSAIGILDGLLATDGNINLKSNHPQIRWDTSSYNLAQLIRNTLLLIGCHGHITTSSPAGGIIKNREIIRNGPKYTITISGDSINHYIEISRLSKINPIKGEKLLSITKNWMTTGNTWKTSVVKVREFETNKTVYDIYCQNSDTWITSGYVQKGCGEQPLPPNGVCNLGSLDISKFIYDDKLDFELLEKAIRLSVRFLDNIIDKNTFPTDKISQWAKDNRPIGLGIMGFADYLNNKEIIYGSDESIIEIEKIMSFMQQIGYDESEKLGKIYGIPIECQKLPRPRRNITVLSIAPTGSIALIAGCNSSIEPIFSEFTNRTDKTGTYKIPDKYYNKQFFRCAVSSSGNKEVTWKEHINIQNAAQKYIDSGVSKTINMPNSATKNDVFNAFMYAFQSPYVKGITIYRNGSRNAEVLSPEKPKDDMICPLCGEILIKEAGCKHCSNCEYSVCEIS